MLSVIKFSGGLGIGDRNRSQVTQFKTERTEDPKEIIEETAYDDVETKITMETGNLARVITEHVAQVQADLTVMSTHARSGAGRFLLGCEPLLINNSI